MPVIEAEQLTKHYGETIGIEALDLSVGAGEVFGFLGPNGAGKTTTIRLLLDLIRPTGGRARLFGLDSRRDAVEIHKRIGYVPSELSLYKDLNGEELLRFSAALRDGVDDALARDLASRFECELHKPVGSLSHGNRQKVALIFAMTHRPELLILDEPTQGLDPLMQQRFYESIREARARGTTVFVSSHNLVEVEHICDRVGMVRQGKLVSVEHIDVLKERRAHRMEITFASSVPLEAFTGLGGIKDLSIDGNVLRCTIATVPDALIKAAARFTVTDVISHEPSLEDIFLAMYGEAAAHVA